LDGQKTIIGHQVDSLGELVARWIKMTTQTCNIRVARRKYALSNEVQVREHRFWALLGENVDLDTRRWIFNHVSMRV